MGGGGVPFTRIISPPDVRLPGPGLACDPTYSLHIEWCLPL